MMSEADGAARCVFCGSSDLSRTHTGLVHPMRPAHGPFDFYLCGSCGSGLTLPPPSLDSLTALYQSFDRGLPELHRTITADDPQDGLYDLCVDRVAELTGHSPGDHFRWIDVAAGGGELAASMCERFPASQGRAIDLHERPASLDDLDRVEWRTCDLNAPDFAAPFEGGADVVTAIAVWEHVVSPDRFVRNLVRLLDPDARPGLIYLLCPDYGSAARRLMGERWPYFTPGEHLFIPTTQGAERCLVSQCEAAARTTSEIWARAVRLRDSVRYAVLRAGFPLALGRWIPRSLRVGMPAGALEAAVICR